MQTWTLAALREAVRDHLGAHSDALLADTIDDAINRAIVAAYPAWYSLGSSTFSGVASTYEYSLNTDSKNIVKLEVEEPDGTWSPLTRWDVSPTSNSTTSKIHLRDYDHAGETLRQVYMVPPSTLSATDSTTVVHVDYIVPKAGIDLCMMLAQSDAEWRDFYLVERDKCRGLADRARATKCMRPMAVVKGPRRPR